MSRDEEVRVLCDVERQCLCREKKKIKKNNVKTVSPFDTRDRPAAHSPTVLTPSPPSFSTLNNIIDIGLADYGSRAPSAHNQRGHNNDNDEEEVPIVSNRQFNRFPNTDQK